MNRERWKRIEAIVDRALDAPPEEREAVVVEACSADPALEKEVRDFLASIGEADALFEQGPGDLVRHAFTSAPSSSAGGLRPGDVVGAYRLVEQIGSGGMGVVFRAERADGEFEKRVALKVIKAGLDTDDIVARFHDERRILARLQHPCIAALLDGGGTADGLPYFVLEYAPGEPIDRYLRNARAGLEERLTIFLSVCDAVQYAHQQLIVHRDLKPSNVLVAQGKPKLLDFGIAKVLDPETGASPSKTQLAERRLTPHYAAPEQVRGDAVTTATDVYSLGVILYELLAERLPYDLGGASLTDMMRIVCQTVPPPPSASVQGEAAPRAWRIPPDLDAIVLNALHKEPERRYVSVAAFAEDIRRFMAGRTVHAQPDTALYRAAKFVRRNAPLVVAAAIAVLALVAGLIAAGWQARIAAAERDRREQEARTAAAARDFLLLTLRDLDPDRPGGQRTFTPAQLIERGLTNLDALSREPEVRAPVMNTLAQVMFNLGERDRADSLFKKAYDLLEPLGAHPDRAASLMGIGQALQLDLRFAEARDVYRQALEIRREALGPRHPAVGESMAALAFSIYTLASSEPQESDSLLVEAEALYTEALAQADLASPVRARILEGLGDIEFTRGRRLAAEGAPSSDVFGRAEERYRAALAAAAEVGSAPTPDDARRMWGLAEALGAKGDAAGAVEASRRALAVLTRTYGEGHPDVALANYYLAQSLYRAERPAEAALAYERAADLSADHAGAHQLYTADALRGAGTSWLQAGRASDALAALDRSLLWYEASVAELGVTRSLADDRVAGVHRNRGRALLELGDLRQAIIALRSAYELWSALGRSTLAGETAALLADAFGQAAQPDSARAYRGRARAPGPEGS